MKDAPPWFNRLKTLTRYETATFTASITPNSLRRILSQLSTSRASVSGKVPPYKMFTLKYPDPSFVIDDKPDRSHTYLVAFFDWPHVAMREARKERLAASGKARPKPVPVVKYAKASKDKPQSRNRPTHDSDGILIRYDD